MFCPSRGERVDFSTARTLHKRPGMKTNLKKLTMKRETIHTLNTRQLEAVVGGSYVGIGSSLGGWTVISSSLAGPSGFCQTGGIGVGSTTICTIAG
jgi:hypothetical protein